MTPRNPADRPATEPRTEAGKELWNDLAREGCDWQDFRDGILAIEAEAAQGAAPRPCDCGSEKYQGVHIDNCTRTRYPAGGRPNNDYAQMLREYMSQHHIYTDHAAELLDAALMEGAAPLDPWHPDGDCLAPTACGVTGYYCSNWRAAPRAEGLDVATLSEWLHATHTAGEPCPYPRHTGYAASIAGRRSCDVRAERILARLSRPSDERVPESEEPR